MPASPLPGYNKVHCAFQGRPLPLSLTGTFRQDRRAQDTRTICNNRLRGLKARDCVFVGTELSMFHFGLSWDFQRKATEGHFWYTDSDVKLTSLPLVRICGFNAFICAASVLFDDVLSFVSNRDRSQCCNQVMMIPSILYSKKDATYSTETSVTIYLQSWCRGSWGQSRSSNNVAESNLCFSSLDYIPLTERMSSEQRIGKCVKRHFAA